MARKKILNYIFFFCLIIIPLIISFYVILELQKYEIIIYEKNKRSNFQTVLNGEESLVNTSRKNIYSKSVKMGEDCMLIYNKSKTAVETTLPHPYAGFKYEPNLDIPWKNFFINEQGHITNVKTKSKMNDTFRIGIIGGSTAEMMSTQSNSFFKTIGELFPNKNIEIINAASPSLISNQELSILIHELIDYDIDLLVSLDGWNDIHHILHMNSRVGWPPFCWRDIYYEFNSTRPKHYETSAKKVSETAANFLSVISKISTISNAYDIPYIAIIQPFRGFEDTICTKEYKTLEEIYYCTITEQFELWNQFKYKENTYVSFAELIEDKYFEDAVHFNSDKPYQIVSSEIGKLINDNQYLMD